MKRPANITEFFQEAPSWLSAALKAISRWRGIDWTRAPDYDTDDDLGDDGRKPAPTFASAEVFGSRLADTGEHLVMLDIDINAAFIPSSTPGHGHLVFDATASWDDYKAFLKAAANVGIIEEGYYKFAEARGETFLRAPWVRKGNERADAADANARWLLDDEFVQPAQEVVF